MNKNLGCPCVLCGENNPNNFRIWFDSYLKLYKCLKCGFIAQYPGPGENTIINNYEDNYSLDFLKQNKEFMYPERRIVLQDIVDRIYKIKSKGSLLDIGCGDGHLLYLCKKRFPDCYGVEYSKDLSKFASSKTNFPIIQGKYCKEIYPPNKFDIITIIQVLEHIPNPVDFLEIVHYHLKKNGILVIEIPSISAPHFLAYRFTGIKKFVRPPDGIINCHCSYFSSKTLKLLLKNCGFEHISLITGRWSVKYGGTLHLIGKIIDPALNFTRIGGILYIAKKSDTF